uniref:Rab-GAP TBC domain-containing protein n=1 Tax=Spongospora subterranea TaxID=70186 RepID=A0A0H5RE29_9EUKA|eukprot:CRZ12021.1 hypothetical protein [Spongospora subterranea]
MQSHVVYGHFDTVEDQRKKIIEAIEEYPVYWSAKRSVKELCMKQTVSEIEGSIESLLFRSPLAPRLESVIHFIDRNANHSREYKFAGVDDRYEPLDFVEKLRMQWDSRMRYQLRAIASHQKRPLLMPRIRPSRDRDQEEQFPSHLIYSWTDLLNEIENLSNPNAASSAENNITGFGSVKLCLRTPTLDLLRRRYCQLSPNIRHVGLDDELSGLGWFRSQQNSDGERLLNDTRTSTAELMVYAQTGIPASLRPRFWKRILGVWSSERDLAHYEKLISQVRRWDMITDDLYRLEVQETTDNAAYFVFEDMLDEMMLAFSRDSWVPRNSILPLSVAPLTTNIFDDSENSQIIPSNSHQPPQFVPVQKSLTAMENSGLELNDQGDTIIPPCQIVPFHLQVMLAAPLCYLFQQAEQTYFVYRQMYARYFCRLHLISSRKDTIIYLCKLFEDLVQSDSPQVFYHAVEAGLPPLRVVFPWLFTAFSGYLAVDQVLILWDRILAYDSLELLSVLAAAIFVFRSKSVMNASSGDEIRDIFEDGAHFRVLPLLQHFLFDSSR